jgi:hypothetical protein
VEPLLFDFTVRFGGLIHDVLHATVDMLAVLLNVPFPFSPMVGLREYCRVEHLWVDQAPSTLSTVFTMSSASVSHTFFNALDALPDAGKRTLA